MLVFTDTSSLAFGAGGQTLRAPARQRRQGVRGNTSLRRLLKAISEHHFAIDPDKDIFPLNQLAGPRKRDIEPKPGSGMPVRITAKP